MFNTTINSCTMILTKIEPTGNNFYKVTVTAYSNPETFSELQLTNKRLHKKKQSLTNIRSSKASALQAAECMKRCFMRDYYNSIRAIN
ncbi:hypothetical protein D3C80_1614160 [compost metagenome]